MSLASFLDSIPFVDSDADRDARFPAPKRNLRVMYATGAVKRFDGAAWVPQPVFGGFPILPEEAGLVTPANSTYAYGDARRFGAQPALTAEDIANGILLVEAINTPAIQNAILWQLGMTSLTDAPPGEGGQVIPIKMWDTYPITTVYCPSGTDIRGGSPRRKIGFSSTTAAPVLVWGRNLAESVPFVGTFRDFVILGDQTKAGQHAVQCQMLGGGNANSIGRTEVSNIKIDSMGGSGFRLMGDAGNMMIGLMFDKVVVRSCNEYGMHVKLPVFNHNDFTRSSFSNNLLGGFFDEFYGAGTDPSENIRFQNTQFEGNGITFLGGAGTIGAFGFKSNRYSAHVLFDTCYFEGNGNNPADTTGANLWVQNAWNCTLRNSLNASSNNLFWIKNGGLIHVDGCFLNMGVSSPTAVFTLDGAPVGSAYSVVVVGNNIFYGNPTDAQRVRVINGSLTQIIGYVGNLNYRANPPRFQRIVLRDGTTKTAQDGSFSLQAVKRILNNADSAVSIPVGGIGTLIKGTYSGTLLVHAHFQGSALFLVNETASGAGVAIAAKVGAWSTVKDTAASMNVYYDAGVGGYVIQNNSPGAIRTSCKYTSCDSLEFTDDGHYENDWGL